MYTIEERAEMYAANMTDEVIGFEGSEWTAKQKQAVFERYKKQYIRIANEQQAVDIEKALNARCLTCSDCDYCNRKHPERKEYCNELSVIRSEMTK